MTQCIGQDTIGVIVYTIQAVALSNITTENTRIPLARVARWYRSFTECQACVQLEYKIKLTDFGRLRQNSGAAKDADRIVASAELAYYPCWV